MPDELEILVILDSGNKVSVCIKKFVEKKEAIFRKQYLVENFRKDTVDKLVKEFCEYFVTRFNSHSERHMKKTALELGSVYSTSGLRVWKRKRIKQQN